MTRTEYRIKWLETHPNYERDHQRKWREQNRDKVRDINRRSKLKALSIPEKRLHILAIQKKSYMKHRDKIVAASALAHRKRSDEYFLFKQRIGCKTCGYSFHGSALDFHHRNPALKLCLVNASNYKNAKGQSEIKKCDLLCANCHRVETTNQHRRMK